ncbi:hypothetical protein ACX800_22500 [Paenarthrobacter nitroguajacolicus]|uniref:hypothetical protein n=1 Tax=Paenarthrobacter nitroguajacolicus TaxID=211146 RepID=UPI003D1DC5CD
MSRYYVNKFLYTVDRDPRWVARYKENAATTLEEWEKEVGIWLNNVEKTSWASFTDEERQALIDYDYVWLFENGAHFFLSLTLFVAVFEEEYAKEHGPLSFQRDFARKLKHWLGRDYPSVAL